MGCKYLGVAVGLLTLVSGCAMGPLPGGSGEVSGPLRSIELYTKRPEPGERYRTAARQLIFASDREVHVGLHWGLRGAGDHVTEVALLTHTGAIHQKREYRFRAEGPSWFTWHRFSLPQGEQAQSLAGRWQVEVALDGKPAGRRGFTFDPSNIRLRTETRLVILRGKDDPRLSPGDWRWTAHEYGTLESVKASLALLEVVLRDELARRFPHVEGPQQSVEAGDVAILLKPNLGVSVNPAIGSRLELEIVRPPTNVVRKFSFKTSEGYESRGMGDVVYFGIAATDLAFQAASNAEVLEFIIGATQAVPE